MGDPLLCARGSAFLMTCRRMLFHEETALLSVRKFPFPELTPRTTGTTSWPRESNNWSKPAKSSPRTGAESPRACGIVDDPGLRLLIVVNNISYEFTKITGEIVILLQNENYRSWPVDRPVPLLESQTSAQKRDLIRREGLDMIND